jgi:1-deoxyxylulose-5-phosphate synthase
VFAGGLLTGKYARGERGRLSGRGEDAFGDVVEALMAAAVERGTTPAALALEFAFAHPRTAAVLVGATTPEQVRENAAALS